jgi:hypothetical protein
MPKAGDTLYVAGLSLDHMFNWASVLALNVGMRGSFP